MECFPVSISGSLVVVEQPTQEFLSEMHTQGGNALNPSKSQQGCRQILGGETNEASQRSGVDPHLLLASLALPVQLLQQPTQQAPRQQGSDEQVPGQVVGGDAALHRLQGQHVSGQAPGLHCTCGEWSGRQVRARRRRMWFIRLRCGGESRQDISSIVLLFLGGFCASGPTTSLHLQRAERALR